MLNNWLITHMRCRMQEEKNYQDSKTKNKKTNLHTWDAHAECHRHVSVGWQNHIYVYKKSDRHLSVLWTNYVL